MCTTPSNLLLQFFLPFDSPLWTLTCRDPQQRIWPRVGLERRSLVSLYFSFFSFIRYLWSGHDSSPTTHRAAKREWYHWATQEYNDKGAHINIYFEREQLRLRFVREHLLLQQLARFLSTKLSAVDPIANLEHQWPVRLGLAGIRCLFYCPFLPMSHHPPSEVHPFLPILAVMVVGVIFFENNGMRSKYYAKQKVKAKKECASEKQKGRAGLKKCRQEPRRVSFLGRIALPNKIANWTIKMAPSFELSLLPSLP